MIEAQTRVMASMRLKTSAGEKQSLAPSDTNETQFKAAIDNIAKFFEAGEAVSLNINNDFASAFISALRHLPNEKTLLETREKYPRPANVPICSPRKAIH